MGKPPIPVNIENNKDFIDQTKLENLKIFEAAATFIQKCYRGYITRHLLREHLRKLFVGEMIQNGEDVTELFHMGLGKYVDWYYQDTQE